MEIGSERTITAIEPQQRRRNRLSIFLDGEFALGVHESVVESLALGVGQRIATERLEHIVHEETLNRAKERALLLLSYRARTESEIRRRLEQAGFDPDIVDAVVARLYELDFLDDRQFAQRFVDSRLAAHPSGRRALAWELRRKGLDAETVAEATDRVDDDTEREAALEAARSRMSRLGSEDPREARRKLGAFLQRRGFMWDTIKNVLDELFAPEDEDGGHSDAP